MAVIRREGFWLLRRAVFWVQKWCVRLLYRSSNQYGGASLQNRDLCEFMATGPLVPSGLRIASRNNLLFFARRIEHLFGGTSMVRVNFAVPNGFVLFNPSIHRHGNRMLVCVRAADFRLDVYQTMQYADARRRIVNHSFLAEVDDDLRLKSISEIPTPWFEPEDAASLGFEDARLFTLRGELHLMANSRNRTKTCSIFTARIAGTDAAPVLENVRAHPYSAPKRDEKNWMPVDAAAEMRAVYFPCPTIIIDCDTEIARHDPPLALEQLRGGSQLVAWQGGFLALVHEYAHAALRRHYLHRFAAFDSDLRMIALTEAFVFFGHPVEFAAGLCWHTDNKRLVASFGVNEEEAWLVTLDAASVSARLRRLPEMGPAQQPAAPPT